MTKVAATYTCLMSSPTRWAGVPLTDRRVERRALLVDAGFILFGDGGEAAVSVRSVSRESGLNTRYFYESFNDVDDLLGAVYDTIALQLAELVGAAMDEAGHTVRTRTRAGIVAVLGFSSADPRRGRILFTDAHANPVLADRRATAHKVLMDLAVVEDGRQHPRSDPVAARVGATLYAGAMAELTQQWLAGNLGSELDVVADHAIALLMPR